MKHPTEIELRAWLDLLVEQSPEAREMVEHFGGRFEFIQTPRACKSVRRGKLVAKKVHKGKTARLVFQKQSISEKLILWDSSGHFTNKVEKFPHELEPVDTHVEGPF